MFRLRARQRITAWIATFAVLLGALAPAISQAMAGASAADMGWMDVCTVAGMERVAIGDAGQKQDGPASPAMEHCPYCFTHAGSFGLPPADPAVFIPAAAAEVMPPLYYVAPRPLFAWANPHSRAPPSFV